jgi:hypothetical protein
LDKLSRNANNASDPEWVGHIGFSSDKNLEEMMEVDVMSRGKWTFNVFLSTVG